MERLELKANKRENRGKGPARRLRAQGLVPAVVYGNEREPVALSIGGKEVSKVVGKNTLIDLAMGDEKDTVILKDVQRHPVKGDVIHVDFQSVNLNEKISITVPLHLEGTPAGAEAGGILQQLMREVDLECLPTEMPDELTIDISHLEMGESITVGEIPVPENMEILTDDDEVIATIVAPTMEEEEEEEEEGLIVEDEMDEEAEEAEEEEAE